jgi:hypothetical protein
MTQGTTSCPFKINKLKKRKEKRAMKKVTGIFEGEKIDMEEARNKEGKPITNLYMLVGREAMKMSVRDNQLWQELKAVPNREPITLKAEVQEYKGELYLQAVALIS